LREVVQREQFALIVFSAVVIGLFFNSSVFLVNTGCHPII
jgi:hypothetical protein